MKISANMPIVLIMIFLLACNNKTEKPLHPNILIIQPDQHRADIMGCAGDEQAITPNLDQMAAEGIRFTHAISASPVCCPFRATFQTGLYIHEHGVVHNEIQLKHEFKTLGEFFSENGYATGYIGKWHLEGFVPKEQPGGFIAPGESRQGWQEWMGYEKNHEYLKVWRFNDKGEKVRVPDYNWEPRWHTDMALDFIKRKAAEHKPWAYYIAFGPPHKPEECIPEFLNRYDPAKFKLLPDVEKNLSDNEKKKLREILQIYYSQVTAIDYEVGRLREGLKKLGVDKNTIIIYVSDHGDVLGSHHNEITQKYTNETNRNTFNTLRTKGKPYSTAFRIPFIIYGPDIHNPGMKCDALVSSVDLTPTILDLAGIPIPDYMQGKSMADWYRKGTGPNQPYIYLGLESGAKAWRAVYDGKYLLSEMYYKLFYHVENDPYEMEDLYSNPEAMAKRKEYENILTGLAEKTGDPILPRLKDSISVK